MPTPSDHPSKAGARPEGLLHHRRRRPNAFERERERTVATLVGEERRPEVFAALRTPTPPIGKLVDNFLADDHIARHFRGGETLLMRLEAVWTQVVRPEYAPMLRPVGVSGPEGAQCLLVEAQNATASYAYANPALKRLFLARLGELGFQEIKSIRVVLPGRR